MSFPNVTRTEISYIKCEMTRDMATAVIDLGLWDTIRDFSGKSFMFHAPEAVNKLDAHPLVDKYGHSGASFSMCLRNVQFIAKNGIAAYLAL